VWNLKQASVKCLSEFIELNYTFQYLILLARTAISELEHIIVLKGNKKLEKISVDNARPLDVEMTLLAQCHGRFRFLIYLQGHYCVGCDTTGTEKVGQVSTLREYTHCREYSTMCYSSLTRPDLTILPALKLWSSPLIIDQSEPIRYWPYFRSHINLLYILRVQRCLWLWTQPTFNCICQQKTATFKLLANKSASQVGSVFLAGAARSDTPMSVIYLHSGRIDYNERHISDTRRMPNKYYVEPQSGRTLFLNTLCQAWGASKICVQTYIPR